MKIIIASNNRDKIAEFKNLLQNTNIEFLSMKEAGINYSVNEDAETLEGNAIKKAREIYELSGMLCVADDTGLFVDYLNGEPGVYSSRYAGDNATYGDNRIKLLKNLRNLPRKKRNACFKTVMCLYNGNHFLFEGTCRGFITEYEKGTMGFGYDSIFIPEGFDRTYAEMTIEEKNKISHRGKALIKFRDFIMLYKI